MEFTIKTVGVIHTPFQEKSGLPIQSSRSDFAGTVEVFPAYLEGLEGIENFSHIYLLYGFHRSGPCQSLKVQPFLDDRLHGIFATRSPVRPNPLGLSVVRLTGRKDNLLYFLGADMLDGTPLLDIKPYIPEFDVFNVQKNGWYQDRKFLRKIFMQAPGIPLFIHSNEGENPDQGKFHSGGVPKMEFFSLKY